MLWLRQVAGCSRVVAAGAARARKALRLFTPPSKPPWQKTTPRRGVEHANKNLVCIMPMGDGRSYDARVGVTAVVF